MAFVAASIVSKLEVDRDPFVRGLLQAKAQGEDFERERFTAKADVKVDRTGLEGLKKSLKDIQGLQGPKLAGLKDQAVKVKVETEGVGKIVALRTALATLKDKVVKVKLDGLLPARFGLKMLVAAVIAAIGSLVALIGPALAGTAAIAGLGVAALGAIAPFGLLVAAMVMFAGTGGTTIKAFKDQAKELGETFKTISKPAVIKVFQALTREMAAFQKMLPSLQGSVTGLGDAVALMVSKLGGQLVSPEFNEFYIKMIELATKITPSLTKIFGGLLEIFKNISLAGAGPLAEQLENIANWLTKIGEKTSDIDALEKSMRRGLKAGGEFWQVVKNLGSVFKSLYTATMSEQSQFMEGLIKSTAGLAKFFKSADGQKVLVDMLADMGRFMEVVLDSLPTLIKLMGGFLRVATNVVEVVAKLLGWLEKIPVVGPGIAGVVGGLILMAGPLKTAGRLAALLVGSLTSMVAPKLAAGLASLTGGRAGGVGRTGTGVGRPGTPGFVPGGPAKGAGIQKVSGIVELGPKSLAAIKAGGMGGGVKGAGGAAAGGAAAGGAAGKAGGKAAGGGFIASMAAAIKGGASKITAALKGVLGKLGPLFKRIPGVGAIATVIGAVFKKLKLGPLLKKALGVLPKIVTSFLPRILGAFLGWPIAIGLLIYTLLPKKVKDAITKGIKGVAKAIFDAGKFVVENLAKGIGAAAKWVWDGIKKIGDGVWKTVKGWAGSLFNGGKAIIGKLGEGIKAGAGAVIDAARWVARQVKNIMPGSEPKDPRSPLRGLGKAGAAIVDNIGAGVTKRTAALRAKVIAMAELAFAPTRNWAAGQLKGMEIMERAAAGPAPTRQQQEHDIMQRISHARYARDDRGRLLNNPPPGVRRQDTAAEMELKQELASLRHQFYKEDLQKTVDVNISAMIPSDPTVLRQIQASISRATAQNRRRRPSTKVLA